MLEQLDADGGAPAVCVFGEARSHRACAACGLGVRGVHQPRWCWRRAVSAQFLQAKPAGRDEILRELFGIASLEGAVRPPWRRRAPRGPRADAAHGDACSARPRCDHAEDAGGGRPGGRAPPRRLRSLAPLAVAVRAAHDEAAAADGRDRAAHRRGRAAARRRHALRARRPSARVRRRPWRRPRSIGGGGGGRRVGAGRLAAARERAGGGAAQLAGLAEAAERDASLARGSPRRGKPSPTRAGAWRGPTPN